MKQGRFITLEGGEAAGKSTQARLLADKLGSYGCQTLVTREPGGSPRAESIRHLLLSGRVKPFGAAAEALFFAVARLDHVETVIRPALDAGIWVICDRFMDSTRAYQGADGVDSATLDGFDRIAVADTRPDLTIILDVATHIATARMRGRGGVADRFEMVDEQQHANRRAIFLEIAEREPERCVVIDGTASEAVVHEQIVAQVEARLLAGGDTPDGV